jgi:hypothetical protein
MKNRRTFRGQERNTACMRVLFLILAIVVVWSFFYKARAGLHIQRRHCTNLLKLSIVPPRCLEAWTIHYLFPCTTSRWMVARIAGSELSSFLGTSGICNEVQGWQGATQKLFGLGLWFWARKITNGSPATFSAREMAPKL